MPSLPSIALVASASQKESVQVLCAELEIAGVMNLGRTRLDIGSIPVFDNLSVVLQHVASGVCCFLTPYSSLKRDVFRCVEQGIHVLSAGPIGLTRPEHSKLVELTEKRGVCVATGGIFRYGNHYGSIREQSRKPAFGDAVYLRHIRGGGHGLLPAWWATWDAVDMSLDLIGAELRFMLASTTKDRSRHHVAVTASIGKATAQLLVAPAFLPLHQELLLLGSGGIVSTEGAASSSLVVRQDDIHLHPHTGQFPEPAWLTSFVAQSVGSGASTPSWEEIVRQTNLLRAMRRALRTSALTAVDL